MEKTVVAERYSYSGSFEIPYKPKSKKTTNLLDQGSLDETDKLLEQLTSIKAESVRVRSTERSHSRTVSDDLASW